MRLLEKYSPDNLEVFRAPLCSPDDFGSGSKSRGGQSADNKAHKGWGSKSAAATEQRGGAGARKPRGARGGTTWYVDWMLAKAGITRQEYEAMMVAEGVSPEKLSAAESLFDDGLVQFRSTGQMIFKNGRGVSPSEQSACMR